MQEDRDGGRSGRVRMVVVSMGRVDGEVEEVVVVRVMVEGS